MVDTCRGSPVVSEGMESLSKVVRPDGTVQTRCVLCHKVFFDGIPDKSYDEKERERIEHMKTCRGPEEPVGPY